MNGVTLLLHAVALAAYLPAAALELPPLPRGARTARQTASRLAAAGLLLHLVAIVWRWVDTGAGPFVGRFEVLSSDAWLLLLALRLGSGRMEEVRRAAPVAQPFALVILLLAVVAGPVPMSLPVIMDSAWLLAHSVAYKLAFVATTLAFALALRPRRGDAADPLERRVDFVQYRWMGLAFAMWTSGMLLGSIWGYHSFGSFWSCDPVEIWALVAWGCFGAALHFVRFFRSSVRSRRALSVLVFAAALVALYVAPMLGVSLHTGYMD